MSTEADPRAVTPAEGSKARPEAVDSTDSPNSTDSAYLQEVQREIQDEVRRRRAAGDFPPSFERKLDELFARFTPTGTSDDHFTEALKLADRSAYFDIEVPIGSRKTAKGAVRYALWQAEAWFVRYVVNELNRFSATTMRVLHLLDERVSDLERDVSLLTPPALVEDELLVAGADTKPFESVILDELRRSVSERKVKGRILHAECGDGSLLVELGAAGLDAYGVDPGTAASDVAVRTGLDVRRDDVLGHLESMRTEALAGLVLSACVDRMSITERRRLVNLAELKVAPGGTVVVVGTMPAMWEQTAGPVAADLAPGRPLHPETWEHLLRGVGFTNITRTLEPTSEGLGRVPDDQPGAEIVNGALERLEDLTASYSSFAVTANKRAGDERRQTP